MKFAAYIICCTILIVFFACNKSNASTEQLKTLDSLNIVANMISAELKSAELKKADTILLKHRLTKFFQYKQFIKQNINDTISKMEADNLQHFYNGGKNLQAYQANRLALISRANLISSQLNKLSSDKKNNALSEEQFSIFLTQEKTEILKLLQVYAVQSQLFYTSLEEFENSILGVETLIKSRNHGVLPTIVKDTVPF
ncbi:MAG: hypothetical protein KF900_11995 [Bacteroidetes bacterium]|nr:hypothetical protein [Bacteroidota bacterium]